MAVAPAILAKVAPPSALTCHWTVGAGAPVAEAVKLAIDPAATLALLGFRVMTGPEVVTVSMAALVNAEPLPLVNIARYREPFWAIDGVKVSGIMVAPAILLKVAPPSVLTCH